MCVESSVGVLMAACTCEWRVACACEWSVACV